jgi:Fungal specific transcription factor domain/Fungal Zn(2)-Cys(6) binuclear cluster domain
LSLEEQTVLIFIFFFFFRIRKVKCDEGRPACHRCVSTGRVCDGYGVWGGGGNATQSQHPERPNDSDLSIPSGIVSTSVVSIEELNCLEWFIRRTAIKLPGAFPSAFWSTLVVQASSNEPAVLHAALALASAHKIDIPYGNLRARQETVINEFEQFTLIQYSKAINHLQPHFSDKSKSSIRVALITCLLFVCLEFIRGHYKTGKTHLRNGLKLLQDIQSNSTAIDTTGDLVLDPPQDYVDTWIIETFFRLYMQVELFGQGSRDLYRILPTFDSNLPNVIFQSINQARLHLYRLIHQIFHLTEISHQQMAFQGIAYPYGLIDAQKCIQADLSAWLRCYKESESRLRPKMTLLDEFCHDILHAYYKMTMIMTDTCLSSASESIYDSYTSDFVSILNRSIDLWKKAPSTVLSYIPYRQDGMAHSLADMNWIPPVYYTAVKCRNHRVRLQAIKLLMSTSHKEGIWDSSLAACIAQEVMDIEESDFYKYTVINNNFPLSSPPDEQDLLLPALPELNRVHDIQVILPDDTMENVILICSRRRANGGLETVMREYDVLSQYWRDLEQGKNA